MRLEILGLFTSGSPLSVSDMAALVRRPASSIHYHVDMLEECGLMRRTGTRPKGKRFEALYELTAAAFEVEADRDDPESTEHIMKAMSSAFRMTERDLEAALTDGTAVTDGDLRNTYAARVHMRASPELLKELNGHIAAIERILTTQHEQQPEPSPDDRHVSLTLALLPLRGRSGPKGGSS